MGTIFTLREVEVARARHLAALPPDCLCDAARREPEHFLGLGLHLVPGRPGLVGQLHAARHVCKVFEC